MTESNKRNQTPDSKGLREIKSGMEIHTAFLFLILIQCCPHGFDKGADRLRSLLFVLCYNADDVALPTMTPSQYCFISLA